MVLSRKRPISSASDPSGASEAEYVADILSGTPHSRATFGKGPHILDHAMGTLANYWTANETGAATPFELDAAIEGGGYVCVSGGITDNAQELGGASISWTPSTMGPIDLEVRASFVGETTVTDGDFVIGWGDALTYTSSLPYVVSATSTLTTDVPSEFAGFIYSSIPTSGALFSAAGNYIGAVSTIADNNTIAVTDPAQIKDSAMHVYRAVIDASGNLTLYFDGTVVYELEAAVTAATPLTPYVNVVAKNSHTHTGTIDYIAVAATNIV